VGLLFTFLPFAAIGCAVIALFYMAKAAVSISASFERIAKGVEDISTTLRSGSVR
jgi:hypothetical protein